MYGGGGGEEGGGGGVGDLNKSIHHVNKYLKDPNTQQYSSSKSSHGLIACLWFPDECLISVEDHCYNY